jgi:hypothetical protein
LGFVTSISAIDKCGVHTGTFGAHGFQQVRQRIAILDRQTKGIDRDVALAALDLFAPIVALAERRLAKSSGEVSSMLRRETRKKFEAAASVWCKDGAKSGRVDTIEISLPDGSRVRVGSDAQSDGATSCHDGAARMIAPPPNVRVWLAAGVTDMSKGFAAVTATTIVSCR